MTASGGGSNNAEIDSKSGLEYYPKPGDTFSYWFVTDKAKSGEVFFFGGQNNSYGYSLNFNHNKDWIELRVMENGTVIKNSTRSSFAASANTEYQVEVNWTTSGDITTNIYNASGSKLSSVSMTDTTYTNGSHVGFLRWSGNPEVHTWYDTVNKTG